MGILNKQKRIMIVGGHSTPAFAVLDEILKVYSKRESDGLKVNAPNIVWVGEKYNQRGNTNVSAEYRTVTEKYKIKFINFESGKLVRFWSLGSLLNAIKEFWKLFTGFFKAFIIILTQRPDIVISFGGFTAVPIVISAKLFRSKIVTHEQTLVSGLANKIIAKFADLIIVSWEDSLKYFPRKKTKFIGNPIRNDIFKLKSHLTEGFDFMLPTIYITGGNQGAHEINKRIFPIIEKLLDHTNIIHQTGNSSITNDYNTALNIDQNLSTEKANKYLVQDYFNADEIGEVLNKAYIYVSRAGANTVSEVMALGKLALLIPIPWASHNEQMKNAKYLENLGLGKVLVQNDKLTSEVLYNEILEALKIAKKGQDFNGGEMALSELKAKKKINLNAASEIAAICLNIVEGK